MTYKSTDYYRAQLEALRENQDGFRVVYRSNSDFLASQDAKLRSLIVFDSSFNPPTIAHLALVNDTIKLLQSASHATDNDEFGIVLLLAVQNADKPVVPAPLEHRLAMMERFSASISKIAETSGGGIGSSAADNGGLGPKVNVAIGITPFPKFVDKADAIQTSFPGVGEQIYITGYDTLIRLFDAKYYGGKTVAEALGEFMARSRIMCFIRDNPQWGTAADQMQYIEDVRNGRYRDNIPPSWAERISLHPYLTGQDPKQQINADSEQGSGHSENYRDQNNARGDVVDLATVSSTAARAAAKTGKSAEGLTLEQIVSDAVTTYLRENHTY
ncbi:hypothetical protein BZA70DRAFT_274081 [Myxozyma melibiosi]|uniref:Cytidyltransferase-like domain-containing protein n=1 Tax=Myxozyma melibiosi TaxID=54550 RepID=A0ABR1FFC0_9ASCO